MQDLMQGISDLARDRGREQAAALGLLLHRTIGEHAAEVGDVFVRDAARRVIYNFTLGLLESLEENDLVDQDIAVMAAQQAIDEVDDDSVSMEYRNEPYAIPLDGDPDQDGDDVPSGSVEGEMDAMRARAAQTGRSVCGSLLGVACLVTPKGEWHVGFETPDDFCVMEDRLDGAPSAVMREAYCHWFNAHFQVMFAKCTNAMRAMTGDGERVAGVFSQLSHDQARSDRGESEDDEETAVVPIDISDGYVEISEHTFDASDRTPVGSRFYRVMVGEDVLCGILELHDADGSVTEQLNLFAMPKMKASGEVMGAVDVRLESMATMLAAERVLRSGIAMTSSS